MRSAILLLVAGASAALAQNLPPCADTCIKNMQGIAVTDFHCQSGNVTCYCSDPRFGYGIRDCSNQACGAQIASSAISYGYEYCSSAVGSANAASQLPGAASVLSSATASGSGSSGSGSGSSSASATGSGAGASGSGSSSGSASPTPVTTSALLATITASNTHQVTTTGSTTIFSTPGVTGGVGGAGGSAASGASSAGGSAGSGASSAGGSATSGASSAGGSAASGASSAGGSAASGASSAASSAGGAASSAASAASSAASAAMAPIQTAGPILGAAGIAALLLI